MAKHLDALLLGLSILIAVLLSSLIAKKINMNNGAKIIIIAIISLVLFVAIYGLCYLIFLK